jgi:glucokinase
MGSVPYFLGVDLGGSLMRMGAVTRDGTLACEMVSVPTGRNFGPADLRRAVPELIDRLRAGLDGHAWAALGFGTAGVALGGALTQCENLPRLTGVDVTELVRELVGCPVTLENDARCFTLAEARYGAARGVQDVCGVTLGTGLGCGVMIGGRLHRGVGRQAGEVWRLPVRGEHLERFLSGEGVVRGYLAAGGAPRTGLDAALVHERARDGDAAALTAWRSFGGDVALLCSTLIAVLDPALIVVGGSLARASDVYGPVLAAQLGQDAARLADSELGSAAGVIGAAALNIE